MKRQTRHKWRAVDGILLLDKPTGITSNAALQTARRHFLAEKAGHTGSLDPLATGMLPVCFGQATKLCGLMLEADKRYRATVRLGVKTSSGDTEGEIVATTPYAPLSSAAIAAAIPGLVGEIQQIPPMYSAIKQGGTHLYELARAGIEVERAPRQVLIRDLELLGLTDDGFEFEVLCSKGTYVRTLAEDWAARLGQYGHLTALRRLETGPFEAQEMISTAQIEAASNDYAALDRLLKPLLAALPGWPTLSVDRADAIRLRGGLICGPFPDVRPGRLVVLDQQEIVLFIAEVDGDRYVAPKRWLGPETAVQTV
ncbi:MAG: tRNA pseudouridine(55) synthase TruB [Nevskia sp.]